MIDTHCHLTDPNLLTQLDGVLSRAAAAGVRGMVTIGTSPSEWQANLDLCRDHANVRCALGVHPNYCNEAELSQLAALRPLQADPRVAAVGEIGLDYHYDDIPKDRQRQFFETQLQIAQDENKPVVIHSRKSVDDCLDVMKSFRVPAAVFHCFTGVQSEAVRILDAGYLIGFTGVVTFKKTADLRAIAAAVPADRFLVETDAPYLSPEPKRSQKICEPALVMYTAQVVAEVRNVSLEEIDKLTTENAARFYAWKEMLS